MSFGLIVLAILLVPFAIWAGGATAASQNALIAEQARNTHSIAAVTTGDSVTSSIATADYIPTNTETAPAQWNWNGQVHREDITVDATTPAGTSVDIYVDNNGDRTIAPITESAADVAAVVTGIFTWFSIMSLLTIGFMLIRVWLDRSRDAQWDRDLRAFLDAHG